MVVPQIYGLADVIERAGLAPDTLELSVLRKWDDGLHAAKPEIGKNLLGDEGLRLLFRTSRRLLRIPRSAELLIDSGIAPPSDVAAWIVDAVARREEHLVVSGLFEIRMGLLLWEGFGRRLRLLDVPGTRGKKTTDFLADDTSFEVKALQGSNPLTVASRVEDADAQHEAVAGRGYCQRGITVVGLAKEGLHDETKEYIKGASKALCETIHYCQNTSAVLLVAEDLLDLGSHYEDRVEMAVFLRDVDDPGDILPGVVRRWCPEHVACPQSLPTE